MRYKVITDEQVALIMMKMTNGKHDEINGLFNELPDYDGNQTCTWMFGMGETSARSECGHNMYVGMNSSARDLGYKYCPNCGKKIEEVRKR